MILERLIEFRDRIPAEERIPEAHKLQRVRFFLEIASDGRFLGVTESGKKKKEWKESVAPYAKRTSATKPLLLVDKPDYVLGLPEDANGLDSAKATERHTAYVGLLREAAAATRLPNLQALLQFYQYPEAVAQAQAELRKYEVAASDLIAPTVSGDLVHTNPAIQQFWQDREAGKAADDAGLEAPCMITGEVGPVARTHPIELVVGPDRVGLVTGNAPAFLSHGLQQSEIAPMSRASAIAYGEALRHLLSDAKHHLRLTDATWVFWTREPVAWSVSSFFTDPQEEAIQRLLHAPYKTHVPDFETNQFFALVLSSNTARLVVRSWLDVPLADALGHLRTYFERQRMADYTGATRPFKLLALAGALVRDLKDVPKYVPAALLENALTGQPLPMSLLHQAVQRARADKEHPVTQPRAALLKLVLLSQPNNPPMIAQTLTPDHPSAAYQCGRLLAVIDRIQQVAISPKATIVDRFYGAASSSPAAVYGALLRKAQVHLGKLRKEKPGLYVTLDRTLGEIMSHLQTFPSTLNLHDQGLFALGFYQQKSYRTVKEDETAEKAGPDEPA